MGALSKEQLDAETAAWRAQCEALGYDVGAKELLCAQKLTKSAPATRDSSTLIKTLATITVVIDKLEKQVSELKARIEELERKGYVGVWKSGREYSPQSECTHDGGRWIAHKRTSDKPGTSGDWSLMEKRTDAATSNPRVNGHYANPRSRPP